MKKVEIILPKESEIKIEENIKEIKLNEYIEDNYKKIRKLINSCGNSRSKWRYQRNR